ncbi:MAG: hypothetical protein V4449_02060 [Patescibacteria group bacterium]
MTTTPEGTRVLTPEDRKLAEDFLRFIAAPNLGARIAEAQKWVSVGEGISRVSRELRGPDTFPDNYDPEA